MDGFLDCGDEGGDTPIQEWHNEDDSVVVRRDAVAAWEADRWTLFFHNRIVMSGSFDAVSGYYRSEFM